MWSFLCHIPWGSSTSLHTTVKKQDRRWPKVNFSISQPSPNKTTHCEMYSQWPNCDFIHCTGLEMPSFGSLFFHPWSSQGYKVLCCNKIYTSLRHGRQHQNGEFSSSLLQPRDPNPELFTTPKGSSKFFTTAVWTRIDINKGNNT